MSPAKRAFLQVKPSFHAPTRYHSCGTLVDEAVPALGERPSRREKVIDAALEMADKLTTTQYEFLRTVVRSADRSLGTSDSDTT